VMKWIIPEISLRLAPVRSVKIAHSYSQAIHFFQPIRPHRRLSRTPPLVAAVGWDPGGAGFKPLESHGNAMGMPPWDWGACTQLSSALDFVAQRNRQLKMGSTLNSDRELQLFCQISMPSCTQSQKWWIPWNTPKRRF